MTNSSESDAILAICIIGIIWSSCFMTAAVVSDRYERAAIASGVGTYNEDGKFEFRKCK